MNDSKINSSRIGGLCSVMFNDVAIWLSENSEEFKFLSNQNLLVILEDRPTMWKVFASNFGVGFVSKINVDHC